MKPTGIEEELFPISAFRKIGDLHCIMRSDNGYTLKMLTKKGDLEIVKEGEGYRVRGKLMNQKTTESTEVLELIYKNYNISKDKPIALDEAKLYMFGLSL